jgi:uncharacterized protein (DUF302 family)
MANYCSRKTMSPPFVQAEEKVKGVLAAEGFGIQAEIDLAHAVQENLGLDFSDYTVLAPCNPQLASRAHAVEVEVGLLLTCHVIVYQDRDRVNMAVARPTSVLGIAGNPEPMRVAQEAKVKLIRVLEAV